MAAQVGIDGSDFPAGVWNAGEVAGQRYSIPLDIHPMTMFYNAEPAGSGRSGWPTHDG